MAINLIGLLSYFNDEQKFDEYGSGPKWIGDSAKIFPHASYDTGEPQNEN